MENKYIEFFINQDNVLFNRDNIALFAVLKDKSNYLCAVIVATTHLLFNKKRGNIKLSQITIICEILNDLQNKYCI